MAQKLRRLVRGLRRHWRGLTAGTLLGLCATLALLAVLDARYPFPLDVLRGGRGAPSSALVEDVAGGTLARRVAADGQWRRPIPLAQMGRWLPLATIAVEDQRFRRHRGVDPLAVLRAVGLNLRSRRIRSGASTLTMQLVGMTLPQPRTLRGKAVEALRALQLERLLSKDELLEHYLNLAPYGGNLTGVQVSAQHWFGKAPVELSLVEAALLAGLPQGPSRLRPDRHPERALKRRAKVLERMWQSRFIDEGQYGRALAAPLGLVSGRAPGGTPDKQVGARPAHAFHAASWALQRRKSGGQTTLVPALQREVERVVAAHLPNLPRGSDVAVVAIDVQRACVAALLGSADPRDPHHGQVDGTRAWRSPGSTLKPFIYGAAFEAGRLAPETLVEDTPLDLGGWRPANFDGGFDGAVRASEALRRSLNLPALRVAQRVGLERCVGLVEAAGVRLAPLTSGNAGLAFVTGGAAVRLIDLVNAYATLARGGERVPLRLFVDEPLRSGSQVLSSDTCEQLFEILSDGARSPNIRSGASHVVFPGTDGGCAVSFMWKTGTSSGHADAWAVGHDRDLAMGVWVGRFDGAGHPRYVGREVAEPILAELFASGVWAP